MSRRPTERSRCLRRYASYDLLAYPADQPLCPHVQRVARAMWAHTMSRIALEKKKELAMPVGEKVPMLTRQP